MPQLALAASFSVPKDSEGSINQTENAKNAYLVGNSVSFTGRAEQDVIVAGNNLNISGSVGASLMAAGNVLTISGPVKNSVRVAGNTINIQDSIGADLLVAGNSIVLGQNSTVGDDFYAAGASIDLLGKVGNDAKLTGGQININGEVQGDLVIKNCEKVVIGPRAVISGSFTYSAMEPAQIDPSAKISGEVKFSKIDKANKTKAGFELAKIAGIFTLFSLIMLIGAFLTLWLLSYIFKKTTKNLLQEAFAKPGETMAWGFVYLIVTPIAAIILLFTAVGIPLSLLAFAFWGLLIGLAKLITPIFAGSLLFKWFSKDKILRLDWLTILIGLIATTIIDAIPFIGGLAIFLVYLMVFGVLAQKVVYFIKSEK